MLSWYWNEFDDFDIKMRTKLAAKKVSYKLHSHSHLCFAYFLYFWTILFALVITFINKNVTCYMSTVNVIFFISSSCSCVVCLLFQIYNNFKFQISISTSLFHVSHSKFQIIILYYVFRSFNYEIVIILAII